MSLALGGTLAHKEVLVMLLLLALRLRRRGPHHELLLAQLVWAWAARGLHQAHEESGIAVEVLLGAGGALARGVLALGSELVEHLWAGGGLAHGRRAVAEEVLECGLLGLRLAAA